MLLYIGNGDEIGSTIVIAKLQVPLRSLETAAATVNLAQPFERRDRDLVGRETYDWAVALMCGEDASGLITRAALPPYPCGKKGSAGVAGGEFGERGDKGGVEHETVEDVNEDESYSEYDVKGHSEIRELVICGFRPDVLHRNIFGRSMFLHPRTKDLFY